MDIAEIYSYKVVRVDAGAAVMLRRIEIYLCFLLFIVATALVVLFLLFERYMQLLICGGLYGVGILLLLISGKGDHFFVYRFHETVLEIESDRGELQSIPLDSAISVRPAEDPQTDENGLRKYCFSNNKVTSRTIVKDGRFKEYIITIENADILLLLDDYSLVLLQRRAQ